MTREQIIDGLKFTVEMFLLDPSTGETITEPRNDMDKITIDACRSAIELLEQESCEESVSRQAVLNKINEHWLNGTVAYRIIERISDDIKTLPSVKPQEKTGHWIEHPEIETSTPEYLMFYECSECGDKQCFCKSDIHKKHFCNNCGAKMVEPQERSEE